MKEQFVTYEIALKLKELWFDEECIAWYYLPANAINENDYFLALDSETPENQIVYIKAPLWQQCIDWFRKKHCIYITVEPLYRPKRFDGIIKHYYAISYKDNYYGGIDDCVDAWIGLSDDGIDYHITDTYEEALEQGILIAIELIKNK